MRIEKSKIDLEKGMCIIYNCERHVFFDHMCFRHNIIFFWDCITFKS